MASIVKKGDGVYYYTPYTCVYYITCEHLNKCYKFSMEWQCKYSKTWKRGEYTILLHTHTHTHAQRFWTNIQQMYIGRYPLVCMLKTMRCEIWGWNGRNLKIKNHPQKSANKCLCIISIRYYITMIYLSVLIRFWLPLWYLQALLLYQSCMLKTCSPLKCTETYTSKFYFNLRKKIYSLHFMSSFG